MAGRFQKLLKSKLVIAGLTGGLAGSIYLVFKPTHQDNRYLHGAANIPQWSHNPLPSRASLLESLENNEEFDILIIGGGATGCGVALDALSRGLNTALVEKYDFSSGTSSRSTKLIHGGVRYLQKAIMGLDYGQYKLVKEALHERANLLDIAPHLSYPLPIMLPVYQYWKLPYFWAGIKMYDLVAGKQCLQHSYLLGKKKTLERFPMLKKDKLKGSIIYYDGQHNDARMNIALALTAARQGGTITNHTEVLKLLRKKDETGKEVICGATVRDTVTGKEFDVRAKCVVNATGPFTDSIRNMADPERENICQGSSGTHIILPGYYSPDMMGLLDPSTSDGRVIFFLPWEGYTIAGTTDSPTKITHHPEPTEGDIQFILNEIKRYLSPDVHVRRGDVLSAWTGIRPLVTDPNSPNTQSISRDHVVDVSPSKLVTIAGGKWTTYRAMAIDTVDACIKHLGLQAKSESGTDGMILDGGHGWSPNLFIHLAQDYGLETDVAKHLANTYGDKAGEVAKLAKVTGKRWPAIGKRLVEDLPYIEAEVQYACREYACTAVDVLARRTRIAFLNVHAAEEAIPLIINIMSTELKWSKNRQKEEEKQALEFLYLEMGKKAQEGLMNANSGVTLSAGEIDRYKRRFNLVDKSHKGFITRHDLEDVIKEMSDVNLTSNDLSEMLNEVDLNKNGQVELDEFIQLMNNVKEGRVTGNRLANLLRKTELSADKGREKISIYRSGGGV